MTTIDFETMVAQASAYCSLGMIRGAIALYAPHLTHYEDAALRYDAIDRVHFTRTGLPFHRDLWDNRRRR